MTAQVKTREVIPDWLKGLAIVLMVYGHVSYVGSLSAFQKQVQELIYTFHMPLFLMISGFFFNTKGEPLAIGNKLISRLVRPYLIFISLYLIGLTLIQRTGIPTNNAPPESFSDFLEIVFLNPRGAYWFIHSLILIQLCFIFAKFITLQARLDETSSLVISLSLLAIACSFHLLAPRTALYFLLGMALGRFAGVLPAAQKTGILLIISIFLVGQDEIYIFSFMQVVWCLSIMVFLSGLGRFIEHTSVVSIFAWLGRNSLIVLVLHALFIVLLKPSSSLLLKLDPTGLLYSAIVVIATMFGSLLAAFLCDRLRLSYYLFGVRTLYSTLEPALTPSRPRPHSPELRP